MTTRRHAIITASDEKYGAFLIHHWLASLRDHVNLANIDVIVLDYGLADEQRKQLLALGVAYRSSERNGHVNAIRYRDICTVLQGKDYDQVLSVDSGDIIFQADVSHLFEQDKTAFRAVCEENGYPLNGTYWKNMTQPDIRPETFKMIAKKLKGKKVINGGFVLGPARGFIALWETFEALMDSYFRFGPDQIMVNYRLYEDGFVELPNSYNFSIVGMTTPFSIKDGSFHFRHGELIPVVHNSGMKPIFRCIYNFGYGRTYNKKKLLMPWFLRVFFRTVRWYRKWV